MLAEYARHPEMYLDERGMKKMADVSRELWRRLEESLEDNTEARLKLMAMRVGDNVGEGPASPDDLQEGLFRGSDEPF